MNAVANMYAPYIYEIIVASFAQDYIIDELRCPELSCPSIENLFETQHLVLISMHCNYTDSQQ
jgi:hypothetical protein